MTKFFRLFFSKTIMFLYSSTLIFTVLLGLVNVYNSNQQSAVFSRAFLFFSIMIYLVLFFVLESNRIYQFFRTVEFRLLPISTRKLFGYNLLFSAAVGSAFFIGNMLIGVLINYVVINIPVALEIAWFELIAGVVDTLVVFLLVQFLVCIYSATKHFVQKRFRCFLEIGLFLLFILLLDYVSGFDLGGIMTEYFGVKQEFYFRLIVQFVTACLYFNLSIWMIDRYVEAGDH